MFPHLRRGKGGAGEVQATLSHHHPEVKKGIRNKKQMTASLPVQVLGATGQVIYRQKRGDKL